MENIEQIQQTNQMQEQSVEKSMSQTKNPYKLIVVLLSIIIVILLVGFVFLFSKVMTANKNTDLQQQKSITVQNDYNKTSDLTVTKDNTSVVNVPSITTIPVATVQDKSFTLSAYGGVSNISFTYPENWTLKQASQEQRSGWGAQLMSPSKKLTIWMGNVSGDLSIAGMGCEKSLSENEGAKIVYYNASNISGINGYKLFTVISDSGQNRIYDSFVGNNSIDNYAIERNKDLRCSINGGGIKGKQVDANGATSNLYIKIMINELNGQSAESEQITTQTTNYIKSIIESDEYQQAKKIIMSARMN